MLQEFIPFMVFLAANQSLMLRRVQLHGHAEFWTIKVEASVNSWFEKNKK